MGVLQVAKAHRDGLRASLEASRPLCRTWFVDQIPRKDSRVVGVCDTCDSVLAGDDLFDVILVQPYCCRVHEEDVGLVGSRGPHGILQQHQAAVSSQDEKNCQLAAGRALTL